MGLVAEGSKHCMGFFYGLGFIQDLIVDVHNGIGGNEHIFVDGCLVV